MEVRQSALSNCYRDLGFKNIPFSITPDTQMFYPGGQHVSAYNQLRYAATHGQLAVLSGEVGLGKTLVLRTVLRSLPSNVRVAFLLNPLLDPVSLLRQISLEFGVTIADDETSAARIQEQLFQRVLEGAMAGQHHIVVVDEAHRLPAISLETLRLLSNLETEQDKLISLMLVGQPELDTTLSLNAMRPLRERIAVWARLTPLNADECSDYVRHRIQLSHEDGEFPISSSALWWLYRRTGGVPRRIHLACERALLLAYAESRREVNWSVMRRACAEFDKAWR